MAESIIWHPGRNLLEGPAQNYPNNLLTTEQEGQNGVESVDEDHLLQEDDSENEFEISSLKDGNLCKATSSGDSVGVIEEDNEEEVFVIKTEVINEKDLSTWLAKESQAIANASENTDEVTLLTDESSVQSDQPKKIPRRKKGKKKSYTCPTCEKTYSTSRSLAMHRYRSCSSKGPFPCQYCSRLFNTAFTLKRHNRNNSKWHLKKEYECTKCAAKFFKKVELRKHMTEMHRKTVKTAKTSVENEEVTKVLEDKDNFVQLEEAPTKSTEKTFKCPKSTCDRKFSRQSWLHKHIATSCSTSLQCAICNCNFPNLKSLHRHQRTNCRNIVSKQCPQCALNFSSEHLFRIHMSNQHQITIQEKQEYLCPQCGKILGSLLSLDNHILFVHQKERNFPCDSCEKKFTYSRDLNRHRFAVHKKGNFNLAFKCSQCPRAYRCNIELMKHFSNNHSSERSFKCDVCGKGYSTKIDMKQHHVRVHSRVKASKCEECSREFKHPGSLKRHIDAVHKRLQNFECDLCDKKFSTKHMLNTHCKKVHEK